MREIKFRAWDEKYKQMLYGGEIWKRYPNWYPVDYVTNKGVTIWNKRQTNDPEHLWEFQRLKMNPEILIMQFTGLKENTFEDTTKNKEIYEGDIVEFINGERQSVEWNDDTCQWQYSDGSPINSEDRYAMHKAIVGNIYENPNIL